MDDVARRTSRRRPAEAHDAAAERLLHRLTVALIAMEADEQAATFIFPTETMARLRDAIQMCRPPVQDDPHPTSPRSQPSQSKSGANGNGVAPAIRGVLTATTNRLDRASRTELEQLAISFERASS